MISEYGDILLIIGLLSLFFVVILTSKEKTTEKKKLPRVGKCPNGCGMLIEWKDKRRCMKCGWIEVLTTNTHSAQYIRSDNNQQAGYCPNGCGVLIERKGYLRCRQCDWIEIPKTSTSDKKNDRKEEKHQGDFCPNGCGVLRDWEGQPRCWKCGWSETPRTTPTLAEKRLESILETIHYDGGPLEDFYERMSKMLIKKHGPLVSVKYVRHFPNFEIYFTYKDGKEIYSGKRTGGYDIHFLTLGYFGEGPRYARHFLSAAGFELTPEEIASIKPGDCILPKNQREDSQTQQFSTPKTIGGKWMAENLNVDKFQNGEYIPEARTFEEWEEAGERGEPAWCYYDNNPANGKKHGKLYNWYAVNDPRGIAPKGWHMPSLDDWLKFTLLLKKEKKSLNLLGGMRDAYGGFHDKGTEGNWWSETEVCSIRAASQSTINIFDIAEYGISNATPKCWGLSVRCMQDID